MNSDQTWWSGKRVLITGIAGFVGSHLGHYLASLDTDVYGIVRRATDGDVVQNSVDRKVESFAHILTGDLLDPASLIKAIDESQPDVIFHLAAQSFYFCESHCVAGALVLGSGFIPRSIHRLSTS